MNPQLTAAFRTSLPDYLGRVEAVQADLLALFRRKRVALAAADAPALRQIEDPERQAADRLKALLAERQQLLARAKQFGFTSGALADLAAQVGCGPQVADRFAACRKRAASLRREGWVHWVVAKRSLSQTTELLDLIAHRGDRPVTYDKPVASAGGTLLDASA